MTKRLSMGMFSPRFWTVFKHRLLFMFTRERSFRYDFGFGFQDVRNVCKYHLEKSHKELFLQISKKIFPEKSLDVSLNRGNDEIVKKCMEYVNKQWHSKIYYVTDPRDRWNTPLETFASWETRKELYLANQKLRVGERATLRNLKRRMAWKRELSSDCDDYGIFLYNLCRYCGVPADNLYLCYMKTVTVWHLNVLYLAEDGSPYAVEGTYFPDKAMRSFGKVTYWHNSQFYNGRKQFYYDFVRWFFNEKTVRVNPHIIKPPKRN